MRKTAILMFFGLMAIAASGWTCQIDRQQSSKVEQVKAEVIRDQSNSFKALIKGDVKTLDRLLMDDYFSYGGDVELSSKEVILKGLANGDLKYESMDVDNKEFKLLAPNVVVVSGSGRAKGSYKNQDFSGPFRFVTIYKLQDREWKASVTAVVCQ